MSTLSLHSLQMSSCTLRRHIAHWGGQSQNYKNSQVSIHIVGTLADEGIAGKEWELKGLNMLVMFTEQIPCLHCHRIKDIKKNKKNSPKLCSKATAGWHLWLWYLIQAPLWTPLWLPVNCQMLAISQFEGHSIQVGEIIVNYHRQGICCQICIGLVLDNLPRVSLGNLKWSKWSKLTPVCMHLVEMKIGVQMGEEAFQRILSSSITRIFEVGVA